MATSKITNLSILDDTIVNADINSSAAIALSKLASTPATLTGSTNNTVTTVTAANAISGEANLTFDGTDLTLGTGNIVFGTASKGVYLGVTSATASNLLDDYEEGIWSPALSNFGGSSESFIDPRYTKVGRLVTVSMQLQIGSFPSDASTFAISGLPFTVKSGSGTTYGTVPFRQTNITTMGLTFGGNNTVIEMYEVPTGGQFNYNDFGQSKQMAFVATYETDS